MLNINNFEGFNSMKITEMAATVDDVKTRIIGIDGDIFIPDLGL